MESDTNKITLSLKGLDNKLASELAGASPGDAVKIGDGFEFLIDEISSDLVIGSIDLEDLGDIKVEASADEESEADGDDNEETQMAAAPVVSVMGGH